MKLKSRLSIGDVYGKVSTKENMLKMISGEELDIVEVIGVATKVTASENPKGGISYKISGDFKMTNLATGEVHRGSTLYLPSTGVNVINAQLADTSVTKCQFAFKITARYDEKAPVQYVYDFEPLIAPSSSDPIALLEAAIKNKTPLLTGNGSEHPDIPNGDGVEGSDTPSPDEIEVAKAKAAAKVAKGETKTSGKKEKEAV